MVIKILRPIYGMWFSLNLDGVYKVPFSKKEGKREMSIDFGLSSEYSVSFRTNSKCAKDGYGGSGHPLKDGIDFIVLKELPDELKDTLF